MTEIPDSQTADVIESFGEETFSTLQFAETLERTFTKTMEALIAKYGKGGAGAGTHYSAFSRIAHTLDKLAKAQSLNKLEYRKAPNGWGSPVIRYWCNSKLVPHFPEEVKSPETVLEGAKQAVVVNRYERDSTARTKCIAHWGTVCVVCAFDFQVRYGDLGIGYIHVHHLKPLSEIGMEYELDPVQDLRPVCANCHSMLHRAVPALSIEALKSLLQK